MEIFCQQCQQVVGKVADEKIPTEREVAVRCPRCNARIPLIRTATEQDGMEILDPVPAASSAAAAVAPAETPQTHRIAFTGSGREYFRIWLVNTFLTIVTLGIYAAWAKVRTRRYFYANTRLAGHSFDYLADPRAILKGNLLVAGGFLIYTVSQQLNPMMSMSAGLLFWGLFPMLVFKSLRFNAYNSSYRNIRFRFLGDMGDSYKIYLLLPLLLPFTLGLLLPYWEFKRKEFFFGNFAFGSSRNEFAGTTLPFYKIYGVVSLLAVGGIVAVVSLGTAVGGLAEWFNPPAPPASPASPADMKMGFWLTFIAGFVLLQLGLAMVQQFLYARLTNYCWNVSSLGSVRFRSTLRARKLVWIRLSNILAIVFSLGLLAPWAKVRRTRYVLDNLELEASQGLDRFAATTVMDESAYGDAATDFFDFEVGL